MSNRNRPKVLRGRRGPSQRHGFDASRASRTSRSGARSARAPGPVMSNWMAPGTGPQGARLAAASNVLSGCSGLRASFRLCSVSFRLPALSAAAGGRHGPETRIRERGVGGATSCPCRRWSGPVVSCLLCRFAGRRLGCTGLELALGNVALAVSRVARAAAGWSTSCGVCLSCRLPFARGRGRPIQSRADRADVRGGPRPAFGFRA